MPRLLYAWRLLHNSRQTAVVVHLVDVRDAHLVAIAQEQLRAVGFTFEPLPMPESEQDLVVADSAA
jgi:hypothetical protein